ncbi:MAG: UDP-N-acetylmuramoyl-L-alanine--D-glutamate ligase [Cyanobacteriota bacterium]|nr:UDP-N-acetylmuramoyl-L-alanine--D-glutamate ligase [Cyanobacteriota bacterium]
MRSSPSDLHLVIGLGRSGIGAARLLRAQGKAVLLLEQQHSPALEQRAGELRAEGIEVTLGAVLEPGCQDRWPAPAATVVVSPGMRWDHPLLIQLRQQGIPVVGELVPAWRGSNSVPWIGITGTNGKTTVTHLVSHLLNHAGIDAPMGGNVGHSAAGLVLERCQGNGPKPQWLVMELSSYQIEAAAEVAPRIGIWTTLTPDHLERHGSLEAYRAIKRSLLDKSDLAILNADDPDLRAHAASWDRAIWVTAGPPSALPQALRPSLWIEAGRIWQQQDGSAINLMDAHCLAMPGAHNRQNMLMAVAAGLAAGLTGEQMEAGLARFPGVPHRLEKLRELNGITFYNDSKATNYDAAEVALQALPGPLVVLAGGEAKIGDASSWLAALQRQSRAVVLFGAAQQRFETLLRQSGYRGTILRSEGLEDAVPLAAETARSLSCQAVLLSPACASFDQYRDFEARGDHFRDLVTAL